MAQNTLEPAQYLALKYINALPSLLDFENLSVNSSTHETEDEIITKHYAQYFQQRNDSRISAILSGHSRSTDSDSIYSETSESVPILNQGSQKQVKFILSEQKFEKASREGQRKTKRQLGQLPQDRQLTKLIPSNSQLSKIPEHIIIGSDRICNTRRRQKNGTGTFNKRLGNPWSVTATNIDSRFSSRMRRQSQTIIQDERLKIPLNIPERSLGCTYNPQRQQWSKTTILDEPLDSSWDISLRDADPIFNQQRQRLFKAMQQQEIQNKITILEEHLKTILDRLATSDSTSNQERKEQVNNITEKREEETRNMILDNHLAKIFGTQSTIEEPDYRQKREQVIRAIKQNEKSACQRFDSTKLGPKLVRNNPASLLKISKNNKRNSAKSNSVRVDYIKLENAEVNNAGNKRMNRHVLSEALGNMDPYWNRLSAAEKEEIYREVEQEEEDVQHEIVRMNKSPIVAASEERPAMIYHPINEVVQSRIHPDPETKIEWNKWRKLLKRRGKKLGF